MNIFWGYEDFVDIFFGSSQNWASLRVISMHFRVFFKVKVQNWDFFGLLEFQIFFGGCLKFLILFGVNGRCWVRAYVYGKKLSTPPPPLGVSRRFCFRKVERQTRHFGSLHCIY